MSNRRTQLRVAYVPGLGPAGDAFGDPVDLDRLTKVLTTREGGQSHIEPVFKTEDLNDCTTEYLLDLIVLHRYGRLTLDLEVDRDLLAALLYVMFGQGAPASSTMLGPTSYILPSTGFVVGFAGEEDSGIALADAVGESLRITGQVENKLQVQAVFVGRGDLAAAAGYEFPDCETITPLRFDQNTSIEVNGTEYVNETRAFELSFSNAPPMNDFPFSLASVDISRPLERGDKRPAFLNWTVLGREGDDLGAAAVTVPPTHYDFAVTIGSPGVRVEAEDAILRPQGNNFQGFVGEVAQAALNLALTPTRVPGDNNTPLHATEV